MENIKIISTFVLMEEQMEQWEIDLRSKLEKELPDGSYLISEGDFVCLGGKGFKIEFEVALRKAAKKYINNN